MGSLRLTHHHAEILLALSLLAIAAVAPWALLFSLLLAGANFGLIHWIHRRIHRRGKAGSFTPLIALNFGLLVVYRHFHQGEAALFLGLAFMILQIAGNAWNVSWGLEKPPASFRDYLLYLLFFPKLLCGPIEESGSFLARIREGRWPKGAAVEEGLRLALLGIFKKVMIADKLSPYVAAAFDPGTDAGGSLFPLLGAYLFYLQLYFDFSGYTDIARGVGKILGLELARNFESPLLATSIRDYWRRWHQSFNRWAERYLYMPMVLKGLPAPVALFSVALFSGFWHGPGIAFLVWGMIHGSVMVLEWALETIWPDRFRMPRSILITWIRRVLVFNVVSIALIFFRSPDLLAAAAMLRRIAAGSLQAGTDWSRAFGGALSEERSVLYDVDGQALALVLALALAVELATAFAPALDRRWKRPRFPATLRALAYALFLVMTVTAISFTGEGFYYAGF